MLCAAPSYLASRGVPETIEQLGSHNCLVFRSRALRQGWRMREGQEPWLRAEGRSRLKMDSGEALRDAAVAGLGISLLPGFLVEADLAEGRLVQLLPDYETETVRILAIYPSKRYLPAKVRRFIDLLVQARPVRSDSRGD
ncbi:substrate binding domain-containing protein [Pseudoroseomonas wenyumeiae]